MPQLLALRRLLLPMVPNLLVASCFAADAPQPTVHPVQAELAGSLDVTRLKDGTHFAARIVEDWRGGGCHLQVGSLLEGHVLGVVRRSKTEKASSFQVAFDRAQCHGNGFVDYGLTLIALVGPYGPPPPSGTPGLGEAPPLADLPGLSIGGGGIAAVPGAVNTNQFRSVAAAADITSYTQVVRQVRKLPSQIVPGQVIDVPRTDLHVGMGTGAASVVTSSKDARLEPRTTLILLPSATYLLHETVNVAGTAGGPGTAAEGTGNAASGGVSSAPVPEPVDATEVCSGDCHALGALETRAATSSHATATLSLAALGYAPHDKQRALSFNHETSVTYLDEHHLLCTFDPHRLRGRSSDGIEPIRTVRAVLIDTNDLSVKRLMEWKVRGEDTYLWRYGAHSVLVHMDHELRLYDGELNLVRAIPVDGPVQWVASSPSIDHTAIAISRRRYSLDEYRRIAENSGERVPDEDLEVRVYDAGWNLISVSVQPSGAPTPVLSDAGELRVTRVHSGRWRIAEFGWDKTVHDLATVRSSCRPLVSSPEHGLTFVTGCMATSGDVWYRMLRQDGRPLLKAEAGSDEIVQSAEGAVAGSFAVRVLKAAKPTTVDQPFNRADLLKEEIGVYRSSDGARVSSVVTDDFILAQNSYALSPQGMQMAVVGNQTISFFQVR